MHYSIHSLTFTLITLTLPHLIHPLAHIPVRAPLGAIATAAVARSAAGSSANCALDTHRPPSTAKATLCTAADAAPDADDDDDAVEETKADAEAEVETPAARSTTHCAM